MKERKKQTNKQTNKQRKKERKKERNKENKQRGKYKHSTISKFPFQIQKNLFKIFESFNPNLERS